MCRLADTRSTVRCLRLEGLFGNLYLATPLTTSLFVVVLPPFAPLTFTKYTPDRSFGSSPSCLVPICLDSNFPFNAYTETIRTFDGEFVRGCTLEVPRAVATTPPLLVMN